MSFIGTTNYLPLVKFHHYQGSHGKFKRVEISGKLINVPFDENFPDKWIVDERLYYDDDIEMDRITGPITCGWCRKAIFKGVIVGYCTKCAEIHELKRGNGMFGYLTDKGIPYEAEKCITSNLFGTQITNYSKEKSMWNTYMKDVDINCVGDKDLNVKYKNGYYSDTKEEKIKGYYCTLEHYYQEKELEELYEEEEEGREFDSEED
jgi:hypothetical protein